MGSALKFIMHYAQEGDEFLDSIANGDETWVFFTTLLNPSNSHCNGAIHIPPEPKIQSFNFSKKNHGVRFLGQKRILLVELMPPGTTVNAVTYYNTLTWL